MTLIVRHAGAPILGNETSNGPDVLEFDIAAINAVINGALEDENFAAAAAISGLRFADATIPAAKFDTGAIATAQLGLGSVVSVLSSISNSSHSGANGAFSQILTVSVPIPSVTDVFVVLMASFNYAASVDASTKSFRFDRDGLGGIQTWTGIGQSTAASAARKISLFAFSNPTPGSTPTYSFDVRHDSGTLFANVVKPVLIALCLKR